MTRETHVNIRAILEDGKETLKRVGRIERVEYMPKQQERWRERGRVSLTDSTWCCVGWGFASAGKVLLTLGANFRFLVDGSMDEIGAKRESDVGVVYTKKAIKVMIENIETQNN